MREWTAPQQHVGTGLYNSRVLIYYLVSDYFNKNLPLKREGFFHS